MAEKWIRAGREEGRKPTATLIEGLRADGVDGRVDNPKPPASAAIPDGSGSESESE
jgi:hypothetical protein